MTHFTPAHPDMTVPFLQHVEFWAMLSAVILICLPILILLIWRLRKRTQYKPTWRPTVHDWTTHKHLTPRG